MHYNGMLYTIVHYHLTTSTTTTTLTPTTTTITSTSTTTTRSDSKLGEYAYVQECIKLNVTIRLVLLKVTDVRRVFLRTVSHTYIVCSNS